MSFYRYAMTTGSGFAESGGVEQPSLNAAKAHAMELAIQYLSAVDGEFWEESGWQLDLMDEHGTILSTLMIHGVNAPASGRFKAEDAA